MKKSLLLTLAAFLLVGCGQNEEKQKENYVNVEAKDPLQLKSDSKYSLNGFNFYEMVPVFVDGHIDHFVTPVLGQAQVNKTVSTGFFQKNVILNSSSAGGLYLNLDSDAEGTIKNALRIELYEESLNKSVVYSYSAGESITEGKADLDGDGSPDKNINGEEIVYTTGSHSYQCEQFGKAAFSELKENEELSLRMTIFIDGFQTDSSNYTTNLTKLDISFELK